jgi:hypothetical protein
VAIAVALSALMPWLRLSFIFSLNAPGIDLGQGKAVLILGLLAAGAAFVRTLGARSVVTSLAQFGFASGALGSAAYVLHGLLTGCGEFQQLCSSVIGGGLYLATFSSAILVSVSAAEFVFDARTSDPFATQRH